MKWVTRKNANVDRVACPWLIRRFIDPDAEFLYVGADIPAEIAIEPEAAGLRAIAHGFATIHGDSDQEKLRLEFPLYDALYAWCQGRVAEAH